MTSCLRGSCRLMRITLILHSYKVINDGPSCAAVISRLGSPRQESDQQVQMLLAAGAAVPRWIATALPSAVLIATLGSEKIEHARNTQLQLLVLIAHSRSCDVGTRRNKVAQGCCGPGFLSRVSSLSHAPTCPD